MIDITNKLGSNQHEVKEKFATRAARAIKLITIHLLILAAAGGVIYARVNQYVAGKEKVILEQKVQVLEAENVGLKALSGLK